MDTKHSQEHNFSENSSWIGDSTMDHSPNNSDVATASPPPFQLKSSTGTSSEQAPIQRMTLFAHGFMPSTDFFGNSRRREQGEVVRDHDYNGYWEATNSESQRERNTGQPVSPENQASIGERFAERFKDSGPTYYFDGSAGALSQAASRVEFGRTGADQLDQGNITSDKDANKDAKEAEAVSPPSKQAQTETPPASSCPAPGLENAQGTDKPATEQKSKGPEPVVIVGHSMGAAYAAGLADRLLEINEEAKEKKYDIQSIYYIAPHQPVDITHPDGPRGVQYSHENDSVSSRGIVPFLAGSKLGKINNIDSYNVFDKSPNGTPLNRNLIGENAERGGHGAGDQDYIFSEYGEDSEAAVRPIHPAKE